MQIVHHARMFSAAQCSHSFTICIFFRAVRYVQSASSRQHSLVLPAVTSVPYRVDETATSAVKKMASPHQLRCHRRTCRTWGQQSRGLPGRPAAAGLLGAEGLLGARTSPQAMQTTRASQIRTSPSASLAGPSCGWRAACKAMSRPFG